MSKPKKSDTRKISEMRNMGPACERDLNAAGILIAQDLIDVGTEAAFIKLLQSRAARGLSIKCCNATYLYALFGAINDIDWRQIPEKKKTQFKNWTAELRAAKSLNFRKSSLGN